MRETTFKPSTRLPATTRSVQVAQQANNGWYGVISERDGEGGKPLFETTITPPGAGRPETVYFDTLKDAQEHVDARVGVAQKPIPAPRRRVSIQKIKEAPFRRPRWRQLKDGTYSRKQGDLHGTVEEIFHNGAFRATFFDGQTYKTHEFVDTGYVQRRNEQTGREVGGYTISYDREHRMESALQWIDDQFNLPLSKERLKKPLSDSAKKRREGKVRKAVAEGRVIPEMSQADRMQSAANRAKLLAGKQAAARKGKKVTIIPAKTVFEREGLAKPSPWRNDKMRVTLANGTPIGHVRRVKTGANDDGYSYYVDVPGDDPGTKDFHTPIQAAKYLLIRYERANPPAPRSSGAHGRAYRPVPIAPPFSGGGATRTRGTGNTNVDDNIPIDEGMTWTGWNYDKREVRRGDRHIGQIRRVVTGKDRAGKKTYVYFADENGKKQGTVKFPDDWQAARHLLRQDKKGDGDRLLTEAFKLPDEPGYAATPFLGEGVSWKVRPGNRYDVAVYGEKIGHVKKEKNGKWAVYPKDEPAKVAQHANERLAAETLVKHWRRKREEWTVQQAAALVRKPEPATPTPQPLRRRVRKGKPVGQPILEPGAGLPSGTIPKAGPMTPKDAVDDFLKSSGLSAPFRVRRSGKTSVRSGPLPRGKQPVPYLIRDQYDLSTKNAVQQFERSTKVSKTVRDNLRRLEASGQYRWVYVDGADMPNGADAWVFIRMDTAQWTFINPLTNEPFISNAQLADMEAEGLLETPVVSPSQMGEVLAISQPEFDNFLFDKYRIEDTITEEERRLGNTLPRDQSAKTLETAVSDSAATEG